MTGVVSLTGVIDFILVAEVITVSKLMGVEINADGDCISSVSSISE